MRISDDSEDYYRLRAAHELKLAERAASPGARDIHIESAERYRRLAVAAASRQSRSTAEPQHFATE